MLNSSHWDENESKIVFLWSGGSDSAMFEFLFMCCFFFLPTEFCHISLIFPWTFRHLKNIKVKATKYITKKNTEKDHFYVIAVFLTSITFNLWESENASTIPNAFKPTRSCYHWKVTRNTSRISFLFWMSRYVNWYNITVIDGIIGLEAISTRSYILHLKWNKRETFCHK